MAAAEKTQVERVVLEDGVALTLTRDEAEALVAILASVGGDPAGFRGHAEGIYESLKELGYDYENTKAWFNLDGQLRFSK